MDKITSLTVDQERQRRSSGAIFASSKARQAIDNMQAMIFRQQTHTVGMAMLLNDAATRGMIPDSDSSGDGNCMFLAQQLRKLGIKKITHGIPEGNCYLSEQTSTVGNIGGCGVLASFSSKLGQLFTLSRTGWGMGGSPCTAWSL